MKSIEPKLKHTSKGTTATIIILVVYLTYLFTLVLRPFTFSLPISISLSEMYYYDLENLSTSVSSFVWNFIINILLFIPLGFLLCALPKVSERRWFIKIVLTTLSGFILSSIIEFTQLFLPRDSSLADIIANTTGSLIGAFAASFHYKTLTGLIRRCWSCVKKGRFLSTLIIIYSALLFTFSNFPILHSDFSNWDPNFTFQIGNEPTLDRPWLGKIYLVAIYSVALHYKDVIFNLKAGPFRDSSESSDGVNLVAFYNFYEGTGAIVHDTSSFGEPLDLAIQDTSKIKWLTPNGIEFLEGTIIRSQNPAYKLFYSQILRYNRLTIEVWISPTDLTQVFHDGPAPIVSFSRDTGFRNFTLGQSQKNVSFPLRTPISPLNGMYVHLFTKDSPLTTDIQHLVVTYRNGIEKLYINGVEIKSTILDASNNLVNLVGVGFGGRWTYCLLFLFPIGFLSYTVLSRNAMDKIKVIPLSILTGFIPLTLIEIFQVLKVTRPFDLNLLYMGLFVILASVLISSAIDKS